MPASTGESASIADLSLLKAPTMERYPQRAADIARPILIESVRATIRESTGMPIQDLEQVLSGDASATSGPLAEIHNELLAELSSFGLDWIIEEELEGVISYLRTEPADQWGRL